MLSDIVLKNRSYRRFAESANIDEKLLKECVDLGRLSASGANAQPLKYVLSNNRQTNAKIFGTAQLGGLFAGLVWAVRGRTSFRIHCHTPRYQYP